MRAALVPVLGIALASAGGKLGIKRRIGIDRSQQRPTGGLQCAEPKHAGRTCE